MCKTGRTKETAQNGVELTEDQVQEVVKQKHKRPKRSEQLQVHTEPGDNTKYLQHSMYLLSLGKIDFTDNDAIIRRRTEYFQACADNDMKPTVAGLALAFGISRKTLWAYANGVESAFMPDLCRNTIKECYFVLNAQMEDYMQNGKINPVSGIFLMKNNMGYEDKTDVVITPNNPMGEQHTQKELEEYLNTIDEA